MDGSGKTEISAMVRFVNKNVFKMFEKNVVKMFS